MFEHGLSMRNISSRIPFKNNIGERGCMALALAIGPSLGLGVDPKTILEKFISLISSDKDFRDSIVDSRGICVNVSRKTLIISKMRSGASIILNNVKYCYDDVVNMSRILHIADSADKSKHFVMLIPDFNRRCYSIYDPAFTFLLDDIVGMLRYYKQVSNREFYGLRRYPFHP